MRGRIRSGDGSGGGKRSGRRFRVEESALDGLLGRSVGRSLSLALTQAGNCISLSRLLCPAEQPPPSSPSTAAVGPYKAGRRGCMEKDGCDVVERGQGEVRGEGRGRERGQLISYFLTGSSAAMD